MKFVKNKKLFYYFSRPALAVIVLLFLCFCVLSVNVCLAQNGIVPDGGKKVTGDYGLNDFVKIGINATQWILGIVGSLALLMFVYGGLMMIISSGSSEKVTKAKEIIIGAVIGLVIVFTSYMIIQFTIGALGIEGEWATTGWFK
ncbi:MAG: pilin [Patescibacteria group bacterium]|nr:pilin [Patescibacteria group bacterium]